MKALQRKALPRGPAKGGAAGRPAGELHLSAERTPNRCRIVLIAPEGIEPAALRDSLDAATAAGDVASLILPAFGEGEAAFQRRAEAVVPLAQERGVAVMIAGDSRVAGRVGADGLHVEGGKAELADAIARLGGRMMVGAGGVKTRDEALELGEERPDYLFFGRFGYDRTPAPHPRNLALGGWWAEMIDLPCIVMGGSDVVSVTAVAATGAEFVALSAAVFAPGLDPARQITEANALLDAGAPRFEG